MHLAHLALTDFRGFRSAEIELPEAGLVLIAGQNNSGKSSLLTALDIVAGRDSGHELRHSAGTAAKLSATFKLSVEDWTRIDGTEGIEPRLVQRYEQMSDGRLRPTQLAISTASGMTNLVESVAVANQPNRSFSGMPTNTRVAHWDGTPTQQYSTIPEGTPLEQAGASETLQPISQLLQEWQARCFNFTNITPAKERGFGLVGARQLDPSGQNLASVLLGLLANEPAKLEQVKSILGAVVPDVGTLTLPVETSQIEIVFEDPFVPGSFHNLQEMGAGVAQLLTTIVLGLTQKGPAVVLLEEPETGLHPSAQRAVAELLVEWSTDRLFIVPTHSTAMIDWRSSRAEVIAISRVMGESHVTQVDLDRLEVVRDLGVQLSDALVAQRLLMVEGPSDLEILRAWFPAEFRDPRLGTVVTTGGDIARWATHFNAWLRSDQLENRQVFFLRDRDELDATELAALDASGSVITLDRREIENFFLDSELLSRYLSQLQGSVVTAAEIQSEVAEFSGSLQHSVVLRRVCRGITAPRLMDNDLRSKLVETEASCDGLVIAVRDRVVNPEELEGQIRDSWETERSAVEKHWDAEWHLMVPGADVLERLFQRHLARRYNKRTDGRALAQAMQAPESLAQQLSPVFAP